MESFQDKPSRNSHILESFQDKPNGKRYKLGAARNKANGRRCKLADLHKCPYKALLTDADCPVSPGKNQRLTQAPGSGGRRVIRLYAGTPGRSVVVSTVRYRNTGGWTTITHILQNNYGASRQTIFIKHIIEVKPFPLNLQWDTLLLLFLMLQGRPEAQGGFPEPAIPCRRRIVSSYRSAPKHSVFIPAPRPRGPPVQLDYQCSRSIPGNPFLPGIRGCCPCGAGAHRHPRPG
ncbi:MAG: hypothetical protein GY765_41625 [bacterium]|nr:hypothetical protein [bacterium]